jgi:hypothetical protein
MAWGHFVQKVRIFKVALFSNDESIDFVIIGLVLYLLVKCKIIP